MKKKSTHESIVIPAHAGTQFFCVIPAHAGTQLFFVIPAHAETQLNKNTSGSWQTATAV